jgi:hypothetical protein
MKNLIWLIGLMLLGWSSCTKKDDAVIVPVNDQEKSDLIFLREEEKLAHDVYIYAFRKYNNSTFSNIANSEQSHTNSVLNLLTQRNISDPAANLKEGEFLNQDLQAIYNSLVATVDSSENHALIVGATIEDLDLNDIHHFYANTTNSEILLVYDRLTCGSRNHMRSFTKQLTNLGINYQPQFISLSEFNAIVNGQNEQCGLMTGK